MQYGEEVRLEVWIYTAKVCLSQMECQTNTSATPRTRNVELCMGVGENVKSSSLDGDGAEMEMHGKTRGLWDGDGQRACLLVKKSKLLATGTEHAHTRETPAHSAMQGDKKGRHLRGEQKLPELCMIPLPLTSDRVLFIRQVSGAHNTPSWWLRRGEWRSYCVHSVVQAEFVAEVTCTAERTNDKHPACPEIALSFWPRYSLVPRKPTATRGSPILG